MTINLPPDMQVAWAIERDPIERLPEVAAEKLQRLRDRADDARTVAQERSERAQEARKDLQQAERHLQEIERAYETGRLTRRLPVPRKTYMGREQAFETVQIEPDEKRLEAERAKVTKLRKKCEGEQRRYKEASSEAAALRAVISRIQDYLSSLPRETSITLYDGGAPAKLKKGQAPAEAVDAVRAQLAALEQHLDAVRSAPLPSSEAKQILTGRIDALAEQGRPDLFALVERGAEIVWPKKRETVMVVTAEGVTGHGHGEMLDAIALVAWLDRDRLIAALKREIDAVADDQHAMSTVDRRKREAELKTQMLAVQRAEETYIDLAEESGTFVARRDTVDPRAVLGLADDLPAPSDDA